MDASSDYLVRQCVENSHCSKITNIGIIREALHNRQKGSKSSISSTDKSITTCFVIPIKINDDQDQNDVSDILDITSNSKLQIGTIELFFSGVSNIEVSEFGENKGFTSLGPIFNLLRDLIISDLKIDPSKDLSEIKINDSFSQINESKCSISASFLSANRLTPNNTLLSFNQSSKLQLSLSQFLYQCSVDLPKILNCK